MGEVLHGDFVKSLNKPKVKEYKLCHGGGYNSINVIYHPEGGAPFSILVCIIEDVENNEFELHRDRLHKEAVDFVGEHIKFNGNPNDQYHINFTSVSKLTYEYIRYR